jgi:DNA adenine methylase
MLVSPLRYPGGKAKLFPFFAGLIQQNNLFGCTYFEPYAGGAGLALKLLSGGFVQKIVLNDLDEAVWSFWHSALEHNDELCRLIATVPLTIDEWRKQRAIWDSKDLSDPLSLGFATFFLNRTNRSGIIEGAGPIGGYAQEGQWRIDARFDPEKQAESIRTLLPFRSRITMRNLDALDFVDTCLDTPNSLTYLDPPYYVKGSKLYRNSYVHSDHVKIMQAMEKARGANWVVSYDDVPQIREIYQDFDPITYNLNYSAGRKSVGSEVIYLSDSLAAPDTKGFLSVAA